jgi:hypothetical protein
MTPRTDAASALDKISIASPCTADWNAMRGDDRTRFCAQCKLNVHDLSAMTREQAMDIVRAAGQGRVCVRFYRRQDGTVLTQDCPVGLRQKLRRAWARSAALFVGLFASAFGCSRAPAGGGNAQGGVQVTTPKGNGQAPHLMGEAVAPMIGDVAVPVPVQGRAFAPAQPQGAQQPPKKDETPAVMGKVRVR